MSSALVATLECQSNSRFTWAINLFAPMSERFLDTRNDPCLDYVCVEVFDPDGHRIQLLQVEWNANL